MLQNVPWQFMVVGALGVVLAVILGAKPALKRLARGFRTVPKPAEEHGVDTDQKPPVGFVEHVKAIETATPGATAESRIDWLRGGFTVAQAMQSHIAALTAPKPSNTNPAPTKFTAPSK